jgi:hypothetical protein
MSITLVTGIFILLFHFKPPFRPYLIIAVAIVGAVFAAMPTLLGDTQLIRWTTIIIAGLCVGIGTWYATFELENQKAELMRQNRLYSEFIESAQGFSAETKKELILNMGTRLKILLTAVRLDDVNDLCDLLNHVYNLDAFHENGTALYYEGEVERIKGDRENMRGIFKRYLANADSIPASRWGVAVDNYQTNVDGYFGERTAWIQHMLANDFYNESLGIKDGKIKRGRLEVALGYASKSMEICRTIGITNYFEATTSLRSTKDVRDLSETGLKALKGASGIN